MLNVRDDANTTVRMPGAGPSSNTGSESVRPSTAFMTTIIVYYHRYYFWNRLNVVHRRVDDSGNAVNAAIH